MPHIWNHIYSEYSRELSTALENSRENSEIVKSTILDKYSNFLGKRLKQIATGGASISDEVLQFLNDCFQCPVSNYYGTTESN